MNSKAQLGWATKEVIALCQSLEYNSVTSTMSPQWRSCMQRLELQARQQMGFEIQACTPSAYEHDNALAENGIRRVRGLAGSLMHNLQSKLPVTVSSSHALWSWCMRHSAWILHRLKPHQGLTPYKVVYGRQYRGWLWGPCTTNKAQTKTKTCFSVTSTHWRGILEPSRPADEDAEAVKAKAQEELKEENEFQRTSAFDKPPESQHEVDDVGECGATVQRTLDAQISPGST
eukprot:s508_g19.t1